MTLIRCESQVVSQQALACFGLFQLVQSLKNYFMAVVWKINKSFWRKTFECNFLAKLRMKQRVTLETSKCIIWTRYRILTNQVDIAPDTWSTAAYERAVTLTTNKQTSRTETMAKFFILKDFWIIQWILSNGLERLAFRSNLSIKRFQRNGVLPSVYRLLYTENGLQCTWERSC